MTKSLMDRFMAKIQPTQSGCWEWIGSRHVFGYGFIRVDGKCQTAHRVAYELFIGVIPDGLFVCHHCDNPPCANPAHLFVGTAADNMRDCSIKGRTHVPHVTTEDRARMAESMRKRWRAATEEERAAYLAGIVKWRAARKERRVTVQACWKRPGSSRFIGVCHRKRDGAWLAYFSLNGKTQYLGTFKSEEEAALARDMAALPFKSTRKLNFPEAGAA